MSRNYHAYGMTIDAEIAIAGMRAADGSVASRRLRVAAADARTIAAAWSGPCGSSRHTPVVPPQLPGADRLRLEVGRRRDTRLLWDGEARFHLDGAAGVLLCDVPSDISTQRVLVDTIIPFVALLRGAVGIHGSAVATSDGVVLIAGSAAERRELVAAVLSRGHVLMASDLVVLSGTPSGHVLAHPATPHLQLKLSHGTEMTSPTVGRTLTSRGDEAWVAAHRLAGEAMRVESICLLRAAPGAEPSLNALPPSPLVLEPHAAVVDPRRTATQVRREVYGRLAAGARMWRLGGDVAAHPATAAGLVERAPRATLMEVAA